MTSGPLSQCATCARFRSPFANPSGNFAGPPTCEAFPAGIPRPVYDMGVDHRQPVAGDRGIRWLSNGEPYPAESLV